MQAVILAAGQSSRFWPLNQKHKSLIRIMGRPLIFYTIDGLKKSGIEDIIIVQGASKDIEKELGDKKIKYITQSKPLGMGDALWQAKKLIKGRFVVLATLVWVLGVCALLGALKAGWKCIEWR